MVRDRWVEKVRVQWETGFCLDWCWLVKNAVGLTFIIIFILLKIERGFLLKKISEL